MGLDTELTGILRDVVQFLECLREVKLPTSLECIRNNLLIRSKDTLTMFMVDRLGGSNSPEPYLNMNAARPKGLVMTLKTETSELQEYVGAEEPRTQRQHQQHQDYYETLQTVDSTRSNVFAVNETASNRDTNEQIENTLLDVYTNLSAAQAKSKCQMYGSLDRREGKKLFVFEQYRPCWVGLVGLHLLIYGSDRDNRPCTVLPIHGYMARAAPNAIPRDQRRSESTFEIFRPGSRTFQFVAKTPKSMEEWIAKICELGDAEKTDHKTLSKAATNESVESDTTHPNEQKNSNCKEERYQDVGSLAINNISEEPLILTNVVSEDIDKETNDSSSKDTSRETTNSSSSSSSSLPPLLVSTCTIVPAASSILSPPSPPPPPPLPPSSTAHILNISSFSKIPRKLPSLPVHLSSYEFLDEEEDDIYHKIEDFRDSTRYGNIGETETDNSRSKKEPVTYDDVRANIKGESTSGHEQTRKHSKSVAKKSLNLRSETTYDDTTTNNVSKDTKNVAVNEQGKVDSYDDVENLALARSTKDQGTDKTDESTKSPQKKSFLNRVRSKKESPKKNEKKAKCKTPTSPPLPTASASALVPVPIPTSLAVSDQEPPPTYYDDVSDLTNIQQMKRFEEENSEYTCPPAPRPIYVKPPTIVGTVIDSHEFYDDVGTFHERYEKDHDRDMCKFDQPKKHNYGHDHAPTDIYRSLLCENIEDNEHYKIPRIDAGHPKSVIDQRDELYDDIAILADFTARQKEYFGKKNSQEITKLQVSPEKRSWNRFVSGKKSKMLDSTVSETNSRASNGTEDTTDDINEQQSSMRMNTIQKLISRMENSFGKASVRTSSSMLLNKTNVANNA